MSTFQVPVGISNKHLHLSQSDIQALIGEQGLTKKKDLSQPGEYAAEETVTLIGPKGRIEGVRILGPARARTQVELAFTDTVKLGLKAPVRESGNIDGTPGLIIEYNGKQITIDCGAIVAMRHIHMTEEDAARFNVNDNGYVKVQVDGPRGGIFDHVLIRVKPSYALDFHIDTDEANAFGLKNGDSVTVITD